MTTRAVIFHAPHGHAVPAALVDVLGTDVPRMRLVVEVSPEVWALVDRSSLFGLEPWNRLQGRVSGRWPVRLELRRAGAAGDDPEREPAAARDSGPPDFSRADFGPVDLRDPAQVAAFLVVLSIGDPDHALLDTRAWRACTVTELLDDEPAGAEVRGGFATVWRDGCGEHPLLDALAGFFAARDVPVELGDGPQPALRGEGEGANGRWRLTVRADEATRLVRLESTASDLLSTAQEILGRALGGTSPAAETAASSNAECGHARVDGDRLIVTHFWTAPAFDEDAFGSALAGHLARVDGLLGAAAEPVAR